jgi:hypothetical protein
MWFQFSNPSLIRSSSKLNQSETRIGHERHACWLICTKIMFILSGLGPCTERSEVWRLVPCWRLYSLHYILCFAASLDCCLTDIYSTFQYFLFIRLYLKHYYSASVGRVPWQDNIIQWLILALCILYHMISLLCFIFPLTLQS